jgi:hypothetical protein
LDAVSEFKGSLSRGVGKAETAPSTARVETSTNATGPFAKRLQRELEIASLQICEASKSVRALNIRTHPHTHARYTQFMARPGCGSSALLCRVLHS